jgi:hypothetical protein
LLSAHVAIHPYSPSDTRYLHYSSLKIGIAIHMTRWKRERLWLELPPKKLGLKLTNTIKIYKKN